MGISLGKRLRSLPLLSAEETKGAQKYVEVMREEIKGKIEAQINDKTLDYYRDPISEEDRMYYQGYLNAFHELSLLYDEEYDEYCKTLMQNSTPRWVGIDPDKVNDMRKEMDDE